MIVVLSEPIRQLRDYFDGRRQAIYTDRQTGSSSYFLVSRPANNFTRFDEIHEH